jgi:hypothetical protein
VPPSLRTELGHPELTEAHALDSCFCSLRMAKTALLELEDQIESNDTL